MAEASQTRGTWKWIAWWMPFVGFVAGLGALGVHAEWGQGHPIDSAMWGCRVWFGASIVGIGAAGVAWARGERGWGVITAAIIMNLGVLVLTGVTLLDQSR